MFELSASLLNWFLCRMCQSAVCKRQINILEAHVHQVSQVLLPYRSRRHLSAWHHFRYYSCSIRHLFPMPHSSVSLHSFLYSIFPYSFRLFSPVDWTTVAGSDSCRQWSRRCRQIGNRIVWQLASCSEYWGKARGTLGSQIANYSASRAISRNTTVDEQDLISTWRGVPDKQEHLIHLTRITCIFSGSECFNESPGIACSEISTNEISEPSCHLKLMTNFSWCTSPLAIVSHLTPTNAKTKVRWRTASHHIKKWIWPNVLGDWDSIRVSEHETQCSFLMYKLLEDDTFFGDEMDWSPSL